MERVTVPKPTPGTGMLCHGAMAGHQEDHTWQVAIQWLVPCEISTPPTEGGDNFIVFHTC